MYRATRELAHEVQILHLSRFHVNGAGVLLLVFLLTVVVTACGGSETTNGDNRSDSEGSPRSVPGLSPMTLDEYASRCAEYADDEIASDATNGEVSDELARSIEVMESIDPPPEVADYHNETLALGKALKRLVDLQPGGEMANPFAFLILLPQMQKLEDTMNNLDPEVRRTLAAAGCAEDATESVAEGDAHRP